MILTQYPYVDDNGNTHHNLVKTWSDDETKELLQVETGSRFSEAIDLYPCVYTYKEVDKPLEEEDEEEPVENQEPNEND